MPQRGGQPTAPLAAYDALAIKTSEDGLVPTRWTHPEVRSLLTCGEHRCQGVTCGRSYADTSWLSKTIFVAPESSKVTSTRLKAKGQRIKDFQFLVFFPFSFLLLPLSFLSSTFEPRKGHFGSIGAKGLSSSGAKGRRCSPKKTISQLIRRSRRQCILKLGNFSPEVSGLCHQGLKVNDFNGSHLFHLLLEPLTVPNDHNRQGFGEEIAPGHGMDVLSGNF